MPDMLKQPIPDLDAIAVLPDLYLRPDFDAARIHVSFTPDRSYRGGLWELRDPDNGEVARGRLPAAESGTASFSRDLPGFQPWSPSHPRLYSFRLSLEGGSERHQTFGMYKYESRGTRLFLNNREFYLKGVIRGREAHDHPNLTGLPEKEYYRRYLALAREYGFNFVRFHSRIPPRAYFEAADETGMLTHIEIRKYFGKYQKERKALDDLDDKNPELVDPAEWRTVVLRVRNHPSLMVYCMGNEIDRPGRNPGVKKIFELTRELDPCKLFLDTCGRGEYDRGNVDFDVKHMGYFCPAGEHRDMFDTTRHCGVFGSITGAPVKVVPEGSGDRPAWAIQREIPVHFPIVAHEICHYTALRDVNGLERKFDRLCPDKKPWWIGELKKLIRAKGLEKDYDGRMIESSRRFQALWWKQALEAVRKSPILAGFHFFQVSDTERYENSNSIFDCFDEGAFVSAKDFLRFNADTVLVADFPQRSFFSGTRITVPVFLSHYDGRLSGKGTFRWELKRASGKSLMSGSMDGIDLDAAGTRKICTVALALPDLRKGEALTFAASVSSGAVVVENGWTLWIFPDRSRAIKAADLAFRLADFNPRKRYPAMIEKEKPTGKIFLTDHFTPALIRFLDRGGDALVMYRIAENRDKSAPLEKLYVPSTRDRFKGVIWDRGHNHGAFIRNSAALREFPHDGFLDFQFYGLVEDADKICLDDFPVDVVPIMQGNDKASRDRFDVHKFGLSELQSAYTLRRFAYLLELKVGKGRLLLTGFNFTGIEKDVPETCAMFEALLGYMRSGRFRPRAKIPGKDLEAYLAEKGKFPRIKERMMTQYWQLDELPVESAQYWKDSEAWLREGRPY